MSTPHRTVFIRGRLVILRPPHKETDLEFFQRSMNDPRVRRTLKSRPPVTTAAEEQWFAKLAEQEDILLTICLPDGTPANSAGKPIGCTGLHHINAVDRTAVTGTWIAPEYWNRGFATDAKMHLLKYAFDTLNLRKICSAAISGNHGSVRHNQKCGYRIEGRIRNQFFRDGRYCDEILLACYRHWWYPRWRKYRRMKLKK